MDDQTEERHLFQMLGESGEIHSNARVCVSVMLKNTNTHVSVWKKDFEIHSNTRVCVCYAKEQYKCIA